MAQDQILEHKVLVGTKAINKDAMQHQDEAQHRRGSISGQRPPPHARPAWTFAALQRSPGRLR